MNRDELLNYLQNDRKLKIQERKLRDVLKLGNLSKLRQFTMEQAEKIAEAVEEINKQRGTSEGYRNATLLLGGTVEDPPPTSSSTHNASQKSSSRPKPTKSNAQGSNRHERLNDFLDDKVSSYIGDVVRQKAADFLNSDEGFEYFADIVTEELVGAYDNSFDSWREQDLRKMRNVTPRTLEIEGQSVGGLPSSSDEPDTDGADFHSYTDPNSNSGSDPDSARPEGNGGSGA